MGSKLISKPHSGLKDECIRVPKVYDWVTDRIPTKVRIRFTEAQLEDIDRALSDPYRRPLQVVVKAPKTPPLFPLGTSEAKKGHHKDFFCEQVGEKRPVTGWLHGHEVSAELVDLLFTATITVLVVDRQGEEVAKVKTDVSALESFALCYPDGTDLFCRISKITSRLLGDSIILNGPFPQTLRIKVFFCADIQVEAEVKLEVKAKFCDPRGNDIHVHDPEWDDHCPEPDFPKQCEDIFPGKHYCASARGKVSGSITEGSELKGVAGLKVNIAPNGQLEDSSVKFKFEDSNKGSDSKSLTFNATHVDPESLEAFEKNGYAILKLAGEGKADNDEKLDFTLDLASGTESSKFSLKLIDGKKDKVTFETGLVETNDESLHVEL
ncbi:hypothetical protein ACFP7A_03500 [Sporolactobacillus kofuensis]|uniref:Uncharacterized protein n=1 Tax=Sporolactobacillus kofuensis TaxID=269672 RepID=A0ABW1WBW1_9BACL|nr:hypothetical protein [Sporolactobacillus kofuensis]MCO7174534.1 hypothetical protein [Sporolactobacillus kofuensis]